MNIDEKITKLYSERVLNLATNIPHKGKLENYDACALERSPLCGSVVKVELKINGGKISAFAQDIKACALGQASAAIVGKNILGKSYSEIEKARDQLRNMLKTGANPPEEPFQELEVLIPAKQHKNRHASIMLVLEATLVAFRKASEAKNFTQ